jgi:hypothetical protein
LIEVTPNGCQLSNETLNDVADGHS